MHNIEDLTVRVERLLLRHEELQRTNALLRQDLMAVTQERDSLKTRLSAARSRIDTLINKLPLPSSPSSPSAPSTPNTNADNSSNNSSTIKGSIHGSATGKTPA